jgi:hypothetical protein
MELQLYKLKKKDLNKLTREEITNYLKKEWNKCIENEQLIWNFLQIFKENKKEIEKILKNYFVVYENRNLSNIIISNDPDSQQPGIYNFMIFDSLHDIQSDKMEELIKLLYVNGYLKKYEFDNVNIKEIDIEAEIEISDRFRLEHNLLWIYKEYNELFRPDILCEEKDKDKLLFGNLLFKKEDSEETILDKFITYGTIVDVMAFDSTILSLSNKGLYYLTYSITNELESTYTSTKKKVDMLEEFQNKLSQEFNNTTKVLQTVKSDVINEANINIEKMQDQVNKYTEKTKGFYKDITILLSILVAAFSFIGVNISTISSLKNNITTAILLINFSLVFSISAMFFIIKNIVFSNLNFGNKRDGKLWYFIFSVCVIVIGVSIFLRVKFNI